MGEKHDEKYEVWKKYYVLHCTISHLLFCDNFNFLLEHIDAAEIVIESPGKTIKCVTSFKTLVLHGFTLYRKVFLVFHIN